MLLFKFLHLKFASLFTFNSILYYLKVGHNAQSTLMEEGCPSFLRLKYLNVLFKSSAYKICFPSFILKAFYQYGLKYTYIIL